jgi:hypothetical protein
LGDVVPLLIIQRHEEDYVRNAGNNVFYLSIDMCMQLNILQTSLAIDGRILDANGGDLWTCLGPWDVHDGYRYHWRIRRKALIDLVADARVNIMDLMRGMGLDDIVVSAAERTCSHSTNGAPWGHRTVNIYNNYTHNDSSKTAIAQTNMVAYDRSNISAKDVSADNVNREEYA